MSLTRSVDEFIHRVRDFLNKTFERDYKENKIMFIVVITRIIIGIIEM